MPEQPVVLTNAFRRPRGWVSQGKPVVDTAHQTFSCVEEIIEVIEDDLEAAALILPAKANESAIAAAVSVASGVMLPGGSSNIHPQTYGRKIENPDQKLDEGHDQTDLLIVKHAMMKGIPILGICRGMQIMNVALGGTLHENLKTKYGTSVNHNCSVPVEGFEDEPEYMHDVGIEGGILAKLFNQTRIQVNSIHDQAIDILAPGLQVEARAVDGVIEAVSLPSYPSLFLGVQWHPEALRQNAASMKLFDFFKNYLKAA